LEGADGACLTLTLVGEMKPKEQKIQLNKIGTIPTANRSAQFASRPQLEL